MKNYGLGFVLPLLALALSVVGLSYAQQLVASSFDYDQIDYSGFYSREGNDGELAQLSGKSHYIKFYSPNRIIRLFIPYPYSLNVEQDAINKTFEMVNNKSLGDAFIRGKFGIMEREVIASIATVKLSNKMIWFDCDSSNPCRIIFNKKGLDIIKKGIIKDHITSYEHID